jgi:hypothetical protein
VSTALLPLQIVGAQWVTDCGVVCVSWQQVCVGAHHAGAGCDVHVDGDLLRFRVGNDLVKTTARASTGTVRNKRTLPPADRPNP